MKYNANTLEGRMGIWVATRIGKAHMQPKERAMRLLEEAIELAQAEGVAVCLLAWCCSRHVALEDIARGELARIESKPIDQIRGSLARKAGADLVVTVGPWEREG